MFRAAVQWFMMYLLSVTYFELERYINISIFSTSQRIQALDTKRISAGSGERIRRPTTVWQGALCGRLWAHGIMYRYPINICQLIQKHPNKNIIVSVATTLAGLPSHISLINIKLKRSTEWLVNENKLKLVRTYRYAHVYTYGCIET